MKTAAEYLDLIRAKHNLPSDYATAKLLGASRQAISNYRCGISHFDANAAEKVAAELGIPEEQILLDAALSRAKSDSERKAWQRVIERLGGVAAGVALAAVMVGHSAPVEAAFNAPIVSQLSLADTAFFIMSSWKKKAKRLLLLALRQINIRPLLLA